MGEVALERAVELSDVFDSKHNANKVKHAAFVIPVVNGEIYLAERNTPPFKGFYSAIGGKVDCSSEQWSQLGPTSRQIVEQGFERPSLAAIREFHEEMYGCLPEDFDLAQYRWERIGCINDAVTGVSCHIRLFDVLNSEFSPSPRELGLISRISDIDSVQINPLTRLALKMLSEVSCEVAAPDLSDVEYFGGAKFGNHYVLNYSSND